MARRLKGFQNNQQTSAWNFELKAHELAAAGWHEVEERTKSRARAEPFKLLYITGDDTSCLGLPKFTVRDLKNLTRSRFDVIPFNITNYSLPENAYVYTCKQGWQKGANRLCTILYLYIRRVKYNTTFACSRADELVIHADNFSENKNNDLFFFLCELVYRCWFKTIRLEYGPPGHTHNGNDAVHAIHNMVAGNFTSLTLGEFVKAWPYSWRKENTMPVPVVAEVQYDFISRYKHCDNTERLAGFTKTASDPQSVSAWKFQWSDTVAQTVEVLWKKNACDLNWRGEDLQPNTAGFVILPQVPAGAPSLLAPQRKPMKNKYVQELTGNAMKKIVEAHVQVPDDTPAVMAWLKQSATEGKMPFHRLPHEVASSNDGKEMDPRSQWGPKIEIGVGGNTSEFFLLEPNAEYDSDKEFWAIPKVEHEDELKEMEVATAEMLGLPDVRYAKKSKQKPRKNAVAEIPAGMTGEISGSNLQVEAVVDEIMSTAVPSAVDDAVAISGSMGCDFDECNLGEHAVVRVKFDDGYGIEIYKITSKDEEAESFMGINMVLDSKTVKQHQKKCLNTKWWVPRQSAPSDTPQFSYNTIAYFAKFVHSKIPPSIRRIINRKNTEQELALFVQDVVLEEDTETNRPGDKRKQLSDSDSDSSESSNDHDSDWSQT